MYRYLKKRMIEGTKITRIYSTDKLLLECSTAYNPDMDADDPPSTQWQCRFLFNGELIEKTMGFNAMENKFSQLKNQIASNPELFEASS